MLKISDLILVDLLQNQVGLIDINEVTSILEHLVPERPEEQEKETKSNITKADQSAASKPQESSVSSQSGSADNAVAAAVGGANIGTDQSAAAEDSSSGVTDRVTDQSESTSAKVGGVTSEIDQSESKITVSDSNEQTEAASDISADKTEEIKSNESPTDEFKDSEPEPEQALAPDSAE